MKVLLTGYTGFLGRYIGALLNEQGFKMRILLNRTTIPWSECEKNCEYIFGSIDDTKVIKEAIKGVNIVIHCAWNFSSQNNSRPTVNERGAELLIAESIKEGVDSFVFISSVAVYGMDEKGKIEITEKYPYATGKEAEYIYPAEKINIEQILRNYNRNKTKLGIFRPGPIFDEKHSPMRKTISLGKITLGIDMGNGNNRIGLIHAEDVADAVLKWIKTNDDDVIINVTPSKCLKRRQWYKNWGKVTGRNITPIFIPIFIIRLLILGVKILKKILRRGGTGDFNYALACATRNICYNNEKIKNTIGWSDVATSRYTD